MGLQIPGEVFYCFENTQVRTGILGVFKAIFPHEVTLLLCEPVEGLVLAGILLPATDLDFKEH